MMFQIGFRFDFECGIQIRFLEYDNVNFVLQIKTTRFRATAPVKIKTICIIPSCFGSSGSAEIIEFLKNFQQILSPR